MKTLIIDTSHSLLAVGIAQEGKLISSKIETLNKQQSEYLLPFVETILNEQNLKLKDIDQVVVCDGPGSYTGMRIGITFVKSIAMVLPKLNVFTVDTLLSLSGQRDVFAFIDARSGRTFGAYCNHGQVIDEKVYLVEDLGQINKNMVGDVHLLGQTTDYGNVLENILAVESSWQAVENVDVLVPRYVK